MSNTNPPSSDPLPISERDDPALSSSQPVLSKKVTVNETSNQIYHDSSPSSSTSHTPSPSKPTKTSTSVLDHVSDHPICPESSASWISRIFLFWVTPLILKGYKTPLDDADMWELQESENAETLVPYFKSIFDSTKPNKKGRRMANALLRSQRKLFWYAFALRVIDVILGSIQPVFVNRLLTWFGNPLAPEYEGYLWALALFLTPALKAVIENNYFLNTFRAGLRVRAEIQGVIYEKALKMSPSARAGSSVGQVLNLMQLDAEKVATFCQMLHAGWSSPAQFFVAVALLYKYIGPSSLIALAFTLLTFPLQAKLLKMQTAITRKNASVTDNRVKLTNEILQGIKAVKFYAWERPFSEEVGRIREQELKNVRKTIVIRAVFLMILFAIPTLVAVITFAFFIGVFNNPLDPADIFTALSLLNNLRVPLMMFPFVINSFIESRISIKRIERFLGLEDTEEYAKPGESEAHETQSKLGSVVIQDATFSWGARGTVDLSANEPKPEKRGVFPRVFNKKRRENATGKEAQHEHEKEAVLDQPVLKNVSVECEAGKLTVIVGRVGSGKSSLVQGMLGEIKKVSGSVRVYGSIAYVPQTAWIFNATLQENVLFGKPLDYERYAKSLYVSALESDLDVLPAGDLTAIGEKGINLSGGQKQRVSIARAVYANADVFLCDDPLSALDPHVGRAVFDNVFSKKGVLKRSTRVLVTNQLHFVPEADRVIWMEDGAVKMCGKFNELMQDEGFQKMMAENVNEENASLSNRDASGGINVESMSVHKQHTARLLEKVNSNFNRQDTLMSREDRNKGTIGMQAYLDYAKATGGYVLFVSVVLFFGIVIGISIVNNWWLSYWSEQESINPEKHSTGFFLGIYFALAMAFAFLTFVRTVIFLSMALKASRRLHERCYTSVSHAPMAFFDTTPIGRIISRFSKDVTEADVMVPQSWQQFLNSCLNLVASYILIATITPLFAAVAVPIVGGYFLLQRFYNRTNLEVKRLDSISKSPIYAHFSETLGGLSSIRAYNKQHQFYQTNLERININHRAYFCQIASNRWFSLWLEMMGSVLIFFAALFGVIAKGDLYSGDLGLSLTYALQVTSFLGFAVRSITELEAKMNSIERLEFYATKIPQEAPHIVDDYRAPQDWPSQGKVVFDALKLRYRPELELVLKGVNLEVAPASKVGIVGKTGAGKSSIMVALLRLVEPEDGVMKVDDIELAKLGLEDLRSGITIIPQDPVMFSGSIRFNLDPFGHYDDSLLWNALDKAHLKKFVSELEGGLDGLVSEYGENLSAGQRQLICLARALLRKPKVLLMDEATSSVDHETDQMIQDTVRSEFVDATILTIAHRLWTIADYDQVVVMDQGLVAEFGAPFDLLNDPNSALSGMVTALGNIQSETFKSIVSARKESKALEMNS